MKIGEVKLIVGTVVIEAKNIEITDDIKFDLDSNAAKILVQGFIEGIKKAFELAANRMP